MVFDPRSGIVTRVFLSPDGHAQERALLGRVVEAVEPKDVWVADRNFCVTSFLSSIAQKSAFFAIRQHGGLDVKALEDMRLFEKTADQNIFEQRVELKREDGSVLEIRRITVHLASPTRNGEKTLSILTNLPSSVANATEIAKLYKTRWKIETAFQKLESHLNSELNTLGYPEAALFGFSVALVAFNLYAIVMSALRAEHPENDIDETFSEYAFAGEIARTTTGLDIAVPESDWQCFSAASTD